MAPQPFFRSTNCLGVRWRFQVFRQTAAAAQRTRSGEKPCLELPLRQYDTYRQRSHGADTLHQLRSKLGRTIIVTVDKDQNGPIGLCAPHGGFDLTFKLASQQKLVSLNPEDADGGRWLQGPDLQRHTPDEDRKRLHLAVTFNDAGELTNHGRARA